MQQIQAFKYELMPDGQQERQMRRFAGSCQSVFNKALPLQKERYEQGEQKLGYVGLCKVLTEWRNSANTAWLVIWNGGWLVAVPPQNTRRTCPACGHVSADNHQTQARFACVERGFEENADVVSAINVLRAGHAQFACEVRGAVRLPAAGTHRNDSGAVRCRARAP